VFLHTTLVRNFEEAAERGPSAEYYNLGFGLYVAIGHEVVHWGADRFGQGGHWEEGEEWEKEMFGRVIEFEFDPWKRRFNIK